MVDHAAFAALQPNDPSWLGPYRLLGRLGSGGMGTVFAAEGGAGQLVAVKVINAHLAGDERFARESKREVTAARRVRPFCTAPVLDAQLDEHPLFIVTEYVDGPTLQELVTVSGPLRGRALEQLAVGMAAALTAIHSAQVVHRDLKPSNVLLSAVGPRVIDFGIARALDGPGASVQPTQLSGTPGYIAPEVLRGGSVTPAADMFAWGCVMAYAASGTLPFPGDDVFAVHQRVLTEPPRLAGLTDPLQWLVVRALDKDPGRRGTASELLAQLVGDERADAERATELLQRAWSAPTLLATDPERPAAERAAGRSRIPLAGGRRAAAMAVGVGAAVLAGVLLWPHDDAEGPGEGSAQVRSGPMTLHSPYSFELDTLPPIGADAWVDTRDATEDLRVIGHSGVTPDLEPGYEKPKALARWTSTEQPTEQHCLDALRQKPVTSAKEIDRGDRFCLQTSEGRTAYIRVVSVPVGDGGTRIEATVWELPT
ncbi:serine/threonine-protein kinase [Streptomyces globisporus]|uniref:serine/threonine-protein kinase n=1 Tax=Streptomyces globisporus TaxID=1908 RepID=UPI00068EB736|nr:serine/threonine-protein kinase [Streptomyces globisporus]